MHQENINSISLHHNSETPNVGLLASGSDDGIIHITKLVSYRAETKIETESSEIQFLMFLNPSICLASIDADGIISFWTVNSTRTSKKPIFKIQNKCEIEESGACAVKFMTYSHRKRQLYTGDEHGYLKVYDVAYIVDKLANPYVNLTFLTNEEPPLKFFSRPSFLSIKGDVNQVPNIVSFRAHKDTINHISLMEEQGFIITSSFDCNVHIWAEDGTRKGTLILGTDKNWALKTDINAKIRTQVLDAKKIIRKIVEKKDFVGSSDIAELVAELPKSYENMIKKQGDLDVSYSEDEVEKEFDEDNILDLIREPSTFASTQNLMKSSGQRPILKQTSSQSDLFKSSLQKSRELGSTKPGLQRAGLSVLKF